MLLTRKDRSVTTKSVKQLLSIERNRQRHWVGDGFPVRSLFTYPALGATISPFLLLDYAGPAEFPPTQERLGVGVHPHRGFETVTIVYDGEVEHRDSSGGGGIIGPGDVQWMTAASGLVHEEFHSPGFAQRGGLFEMVQLWVNLPAKAKMAPPRYQGILREQIPVVTLPDSRGQVRVIAGEFAGKQGPAMTFSPIHVWDLRLMAHSSRVSTSPVSTSTDSTSTDSTSTDSASTDSTSTNFDLPEGYTVLLVVLKGAVRINGQEKGSPAIREAEVGLFSPLGERLSLTCEAETTALLLAGEPINEPIVGHGPFVMNSAAEIRQAIADYQSGKMGQL